MKKTAIKAVNFSSPAKTLRSSILAALSEFQRRMKGEAIRKGLAKARAN